jgi:EAL domain-containing protein (putative c-di-GMP-specific phosphodiesterase class I)
MRQMLCLPAAQSARTGNFRLRQKATAAARSPTLTPVATPVARVDSEPPSVESLGRQLRDALPTRRLHSVSLCDHEANVLWLSEGALGPDEHGLVVDALELLSADTSLHCHEMGLEDGRYALFLPVRAPGGSLVGIAMILADGKSGFGDDTLERVAAAPARAIMLRLAVLLKPSGNVASASHATALVPGLELADTNAVPVLAEAPASEAISSVQVHELLEFELAPEGPASSPPAPAAASARTARAPLRTAPATDLVGLEFLDEDAGAPAAAVPAAAPVAAVRAIPESVPVMPVVAPPRIVPKRAPAAATPAPVSVSVSAPASDANLLLEVLPFAKLRAGGQTRRFQVLPRLSPGQRDPAAVDALVLQRLMGWMAAHRTAWNSQPTGFTINLSIATLEDERFAQKIAAALNTHGIAGETFGFEIAEALCTQRRAQVERFITQCEKVGAWVVIDDFSFDAQVLPLLRSKAVRLVKLDARLTSTALKDKLSQAMVVATVQAAKVLGIHCAAKKVDSQAALQWLTAIGCDFAQGAALAGAQSLESLAGCPDPTGLTAQLRPS